eukprot:3320465-Amphidinium_carterae.1
MHPSLASFPSREFYEDRLKSGVQEKDRPFQSQLPFPHAPTPACYVDSSEYLEHGAEHSRSGSWANESEATMVCEIVRYLTLCCGLSEAVESGGGAKR